MHVWSIANQKGGVGKTTSVVSLGALLAQQGHRVLVFDLDPQGSLTSYFRHNPDEMEHSAFDLFMHGGKIPDDVLENVILPTSIEGMDMIPASTALATLERNVSQQDGMGLVVSKTLAKLWDQYDYALIDTPPLLGVLLINSLAACKKLLVPVQTEFLALKGLERMVHTIRMVMRSQQRDLEYLVIPTMFDRRTAASVKTLKTLREQYDGHIWHTAIPVDTRLRDASREGKAISQIDPESRSARAYRLLLKNIVEN
ncbi:ParA family protein [Reinekea blandensis]|uniref:Cobyrinic acid a,c-diamide synthase n=1 Tax=Reinekea blandensis MED297 TaxID=314283 RepID=A4BEI6_9GAMM|nr:ParA family protein [Reinekea blandensis]EAR09413.1 Cobyrinic acid a,c-diamide synthase [Reinekea sp. MED297] [Reinekea blandensis MED297]